MATELYKCWYPSAYTTTVAVDCKPQIELRSSKETCFRLVLTQLSICNFYDRTRPAFLRTRSNYGRLIRGQEAQEHAGHQQDAALKVRDKERGTPETRRHHRRDVRGVRRLVRRQAGAENRRMSKTQGGLERAIY